MKLYRNILVIVIIIAALIAGVIFVNKLPQDNPDTIEKTENQETVSKEYVDVFKIESDNILSISVKSESNSYTVSKSGDKLTLSNSQNLKISQDKLQMLLNSCSYVFADALISDNAADAGIYGFDNPVATVTISLKNDETKSILIGKEAIDKQGSYIKTADNDSIYLRSTYGVSSLMPDYNSFIELSILTVNPTDYETLSKINITKKGNTPIEVCSEPLEEGKVWKMTKPTYADANTITLSEKVLVPLQSLTATGVIDASPSDLSIFGLSSPYATLTISSGDVTQRFSFGDSVNGYRFVMVDNYNTVYAVADSSATFLDVAYIDLMSRLVHLENIKNISKVEIVSHTNNFTMLINNENYSINGKNLSKDDFSDAYQKILEISFDSVDLNAKANNTAEATIKYTRNDGSVCTVSFVPVNDRNYLALVDGLGNCIVKKNSLSDAFEFIQSIIDKE